MRGGLDIKYNTYRAHYLETLIKKIAKVTLYCYSVKKKDANVNTHGIIIEQNEDMRNLAIHA